MKVVEPSTVAEGNTVQLTKDVNGKRQVIWRNWKSLLSGKRQVIWRNWKSLLSCLYKNISNITTYHHFRFESKCPGKVFLKEFVDNTETTVDLCNPETEFELDPNNLPEEIQPAGMDLKRRWYLYDEIRPFCMNSEDIDITYPYPSQPKP